MKFNDYADHLCAARKMGFGQTLGIHTREDMYKALAPEAVLNPIGFRHLVFDKEWHKIGKPYYDVYPCVIPMLTKLSLAFPGEVISPPQGIQHLLLRLPSESHTLCSGDLHVRCAFLSFQSVNRDVNSDKRERGIAVGLDIGEKLDGIPVYTIRVFPLDERTIEETIYSLRTHPNTFEGIQVPDELILDTVRLALTICLIDNNPEFLEQQVLSKDAQKFNTCTEEERQRLYDKAKRRGKWGFSLGKNIEIIPHIRRPHPCVVWTGHGRTTPKVILRKGSFIHKNKVEQIPTGYDLETTD